MPGIRTFLSLAAVSIIFFTGCAEIQKPHTEPFYAQSTPPAKQEFRWSNGKAPKSFDPARAAAAPETDIVRALFEGLTDIDSRSLKEIPAVAEKWASSDDLRVWTFQLRKDAKWSNGKRVTANDFVRSWKRLAALGDKAAHRELFQNIIGLRTPGSTPEIEPPDFGPSPDAGEEPPHDEQPDSTTVAGAQEPILPALPANVESNPKAAKPAPVNFGVEAVDAATLRVSLELPDKDFPKLVANPIFRPVYNATEFQADQAAADIVTNGPFKVANIGKDGIALDRSETYWNISAVSLEHVRFVQKENAEAALNAYKKGEVDAVTNAEFAPLALKLLAPYDDFRQTTHSALNFYEFNTKNPPFDDRRVREALAISIDRERITQSELEGTARPAMSFLPLGGNKNSELLLDLQKARLLLESAGFAGGADFPKIRLLVNRNNTQQRVARAVAKMWKQNLNLDTEIIVKDVSEIETIRVSGEYDLVRRGIVLPTVDEAVGIAAIFGRVKNVEPTSSKDTGNVDVLLAKPLARKPGEEEPLGHAKADEQTEPVSDKNSIFTEDYALVELNAIPLYFPMAYALVKPYVKGFEINGLDAASLKDISIDSNWQPKDAKGRF